jgi:hypothetical protein
LSSIGVVGRVGTRTCIEVSSSLTGLASLKFRNGLVSVEVDMVGGCKKKWGTSLLAFKFSADLPRAQIGKLLLYLVFRSTVLAPSEIHAMSVPIFTRITKYLRTLVTLTLVRISFIPK